MNKHYRIIEGPESLQGSLEWLQFRKGKISASMSPAIMGESPYQTKLGLWENIIFDKDTPKNSAMERGNRLEPEARKLLNSILEIDFQPVVVQSIHHPDFIASLDGYSIGRDEKPLICEIKCPGAVDHAIALGGQVPPKYKAQVNHQMDLVGVDEMYYASYDGKDLAIVREKRDADYCINLFAEELSFLSSLIDMRPPKPTDRDWVQMEDENLHDELACYNTICEQIEELEDEKKKTREAILSNSLHPRVKIGINKIQLIQKRGEIDYAKAIEDLGLDIDLEKYRKPNSQYWKIGY